VITICPQCQLSLAVSAADLRIAQGHVRCGRCASVFNALVSLYDTEADALEPPPAEPALDAALEPAYDDNGDTRIFEVQIDTAAADGGANTGVFDRAPIEAAHGEPVAEAAPEPVPEPVPDVVPAPDPVAPTFDTAAFDADAFAAPEFAPPAFDAPLIDTPASAQTIDGIDLAADTEPVAANDELLEMPPAANDAGIDEVVAANDPILVPDQLDIDLGALEPPETSRVVPVAAAPLSAVATGAAATDSAATDSAADPDTAAAPDDADIEALESNEPPRPRYYAAYAAGAALLALLFAGQLVHYQREALVAWPALSGPLSRFYAAIGRPIQLRGDLGAYDVRQLGAFAPPDAAGTLMVRASLRNLSPRPQPMPLLRVTLQDRYGNRIASRDLAAADYQQRPKGEAPETLLAAGARLETAVQLVDPGGNAVGFELDVCLAEGGSTRCANDITTTTAAR
jgi:predicted Zn finger-like uncharacterized protein